MSVGWVVVQDGRTALHLAILHGLVDNDMDIVRLLINYGANVNVKDEVRTSPASDTLMVIVVAVPVVRGQLADVTTSQQSRKHTPTIDANLRGFPRRVRQTLAAVVVRKGHVCRRRR